MLAGELNTGKAIVRDYIKAAGGFKKLPEATRARSVPTGCAVTKTGRVTARVLINKTMARPISRPQIGAGLIELMRQTRRNSSPPQATPDKN